MVAQYSYFTHEIHQGIIDIRPIVYYKIKDGVLQQNLNKYYRFELAARLCYEIKKNE